MASPTLQKIAIIRWNCASSRFDHPGRRKRLSAKQTVLLTAISLAKFEPHHTVSLLRTIRKRTFDNYSIGFASLSSHVAKAAEKSTFNLFGQGLISEKDVVSPDPT